MALGDSYEKLERPHDALKCYWKAHCIGDMERTVALYHLAKLYEKTDDPDQAAAAYHQFILDSDSDGLSEDCDQQSRAYRFLAQYHLRKESLEDAFLYAQKCTQFTDTREDGKALLKEISSKRGPQSELPLGEGELTNRTVDRVLRENNGSFASPLDQSGQVTRELEPMNLTYTP